MTVISRTSGAMTPAAVIASGAVFEDHVTPGQGHLFTDLDGPDSDVEATARTIERIHFFLR